MAGSEWTWIWIVGGLILAFCAIVIVRALVCWWFRINEMVELQGAMLSELKAIRKSAETTTPRDNTVARQDTV
jgi:hypothetical protein